MALFKKGKLYRLKSTRAGQMNFYPGLGTDNSGVERVLSGEHVMYLGQIMLNNPSNRRALLFLLPAGRVGWRAVYNPNHASLRSFFMEVS